MGTGGGQERILGRAEVAGRRAAPRRVFHMALRSCGAKALDHPGFITTIFASREPFYSLEIFISDIFIRYYF